MATIGLPVYPGIVLRSGSRGPDTAFIQTELTALGYSTSVDGIFGSGTTLSVAEYQRCKGLKADGLVGPDTWNAIVQDYAAAHPTNPVPYPGIVVRPGALGSIVRYIQRAHNELRKIYTAIPLNAADGVYGANTQAAVRLLQRQFGLSIDGQTGPATWNKMIETLNAMNAGQPMHVTTPYPGVVLRQGSTGEAVRCVQSYLAAVQKAHNLNYPAPAVDGVFGSTTRNAVLGFQARYGLKIDGAVGPGTWERLVAEFNNTLGNNR